MCTIVILRRPEHDWPVLIAANRDEMSDRPWRAPSRHWPERPEIVAGMDELAGGSWLGMNDHGMTAAILNREGSLGPADGKRSRGELVLDALDFADAIEAAGMLSQLEPTAYRPFNMVLADNRDVLWLRNRAEDGPGHLEVTPLPDGLSMLTSRELNDAKSPRIAHHLGLFAAAETPDPETGDWMHWRGLLGRISETEDPGDGMTIRTDHGFATISSSLIALPAPGLGQPIWQFADGPPDTHDYHPINDPALAVR